MKKLFWWLIAAVMLFSCKKEKPTPPPPTETFSLNVSTTTLKIPATAGLISTVNIESNSNWNVTIAGAPGWLEINKTSGTGNGSLEIITTDNLTLAERIGEVEGLQIPEATPEATEASG